MIYFDETPPAAGQKELGIGLMEDFDASVKLKAIGVGGCGSNSINRMIQKGIRGVDFVAVNTDFKDLKKSLSPKKVHLLGATMQGMGTGGDLELARKAALDASDQIIAELEGTKMVFLTAGMGGGTGSGATGVIASLCRQLEILTVAVVVLPFAWEREERTKRAEEGLRSLRDNVDALIAIPNDKLAALVDDKTFALEAFDMADDILIQAVQGVSEILTGTGYKNIDFADIQAALKGKGKAIMGMGTESGEDAAIKAAQKAISSPLLEETSIAGASNVLLSFTVNPKTSFKNIMATAQKISEMIGSAQDAKRGEVNFGIYFDDKLDADAVRVIVFASGFDAPRPAAARAVVQPAVAYAPRPEPAAVFEPRRPSMLNAPVLNAPAQKLDFLGMGAESREDKNKAAYYRLKHD
jgi:cell division protein FtsZ